MLPGDPLVVWKLSRHERSIMQLIETVQIRLYMRAFANAYPEEVFVQQVVGQIPWGHNARILDLVKYPSERECYI